MIPDPKIGELASARQRPAVRQRGRAGRSGSEGGFEGVLPPSPSSWRMWLRLRRSALIRMS